MTKKAMLTAQKKHIHEQKPEIKLAQQLLLNFLVKDRKSRTSTGSSNSPQVAQL